MVRNLELTFGAIYSSNLLNALIKSGKISRTDSYEIVKKLAQIAIDQETQLKELVKNNKDITNILNEKQIDELFNPKFYLKNINVAFKRAGLI
jgi:adenylosuccinate lyase